MTSMKKNQRMMAGSMDMDGTVLVGMPHSITRNAEGVTRGQ